MNEELIKRIDEAIRRNRADKAELNDILHKVKDQLESKGKADYERGMNDIWKALKECGRMPAEERAHEYRCATLTTMLFAYSPQEFLAKTEEYKKKEEEEKTTNFKRGDKVRCDSGLVSFDAIYYGENKEHYWVLVKNDVAPQRLPKQSGWKLTKYGTSVDLDSMFVF